MSREALLNCEISKNAFIKPMIVECGIRKNLLQTSVGNIEQIRRQIRAKVLQQRNIGQHVSVSPIPVGGSVRDPSSLVRTRAQLRSHTLEHCPPHRSHVATSPLHVAGHTSRSTSPLHVAEHCISRTTSPLHAVGHHTSSTNVASAMSPKIVPHGVSSLHEMSPQSVTRERTPYKGKHVESEHEDIDTHTAQIDGLISETDRLLKSQNAHQARRGANVRQDDLLAEIERDLASLPGGRHSCKTLLELEDEINALINN